MARSLKQIKSRIRGIENTKKVTGAMEMISVTKLSRTEKLLLAAKPYFFKLDSLLNDMLSGGGGIAGPFFDEKNPKRSVGLCIITSDSGLCGTYNSNIIRLADEFINQKGRENIKLITVGRRGFNYFKRYKIKVLKSYTGLNGRYSDRMSEELAKDLINFFISGEVDEIYAAYTHFQTALTIKPTLTKFLNIERSDGCETEYILEPDINSILAELIPKYLWAKSKIMLLDSFTSEHAARTVAMKMATDNAREILEALILTRNKVRQANITQDIMEIVSASEALKG